MMASTGCDDVNCEETTLLPHRERPARRERRRSRRRLSQTRCFSPSGRGTSFTTVSPIQSVGTTTLSPRARHALCLAWPRAARTTSTRRAGRTRRWSGARARLWSPRPSSSSAWCATPRRSAPALRFREDAVALTHDRSRPSAAAPRPPRRGAMDTLLLRPVAVSRAVLLSPPRAVRHRSRRHAPGAVLTVETDEKFFSSRALRATRSSLLAPHRRPPRPHPSSLGV